MVVWSGEQHRTFLDRGVVFLGGAISVGDATAMADAVWRHLERHSEHRRADPSTWPVGQPTTSFKRLKRNPVFRPLIDNEAVSSALDSVFHPSGWSRPTPGGQVLMTFPQPGPWTLPHHLWHMDCGFEDATWPVPGIKVFACLDTVEPGGGATLALAGSHHLVDAYAPTLDPEERGGNATSWRRMLKRDAWLNALSQPGHEPGRTERLMGSTHEVDGVEVEVVEMVEQPGDIYLTHLHVFHCAAANASERPRLMLGKTITRNL